MLTREALQARQNTIEGTRPTGVTMPGPGVYWVKRAHIGLYFIDEDGVPDETANLHKWGVYTWTGAAITPWFLVAIRERMIEGYSPVVDVFGGEEGIVWEGYDVVTIACRGPVVPPAA